MTLPPTHLPLPHQHLALEVERVTALVDLRAAELHPDADHTAPPEALRERIDALEQTLQDLLQRVPRQVLPLCALEDRLALTPDALLLLLLAAAPLLDPAAGRRFARLLHIPSPAWPSVALLQTLAFDASVTPTLPRLLDPQSPLVAYRLLAPQRPFSDLPETWQPLALEPRVARFLRGDMQPDPALDAAATLLHDLPPEQERLVLPEPERDPWARLLHDLDRERPPHLLILRGPPGIGRRRRALEIARRAGRALLVVHLPALQDTPEAFTAALQSARREAILQDAHLAFTGWERILTPQGLPADDPGAPSHLHALRERLARHLDAALRGHPHPVTLLLDASDTPAPNLPHLTTRHYTPHPLAPEDALRLWRFLLPRTRRAPDLDLTYLASTYHLTPGQIHGAVAQSRSDDDPARPVQATTLLRAVKDGIAHRLGESARLVERAWTWEDLILTPPLRLQLEEFTHRFRLRDRVLGTWGLGRRFGDARGLSALFEGPPGTGKTMSASVVAADLGLDLYQVDLSRVVSRYIGETEKNLGRIFDEAEAAQAMLLFDEADALFAKRTEVKSSNDRYANMEVNYLLQRLEAFTGVVVLTTNFGASIDDAFARRLSLRVTFPKPGAPERRALWRSMLQSGDLPLQSLDYDDLAARFEFAGGHIKNAVLRAAFLAAARDQPVTQDLIETAARLEMRAQGMLVLGDD